VTENESRSAAFPIFISLNSIDPIRIIEYVLIKNKVFCEAPRRGNFVHIVPLDPAYKAGLAGHVPVNISVEEH
jgi:hypothetical protein